ncbi:MAG: hypothetical protein IKR07_01675 [Oscillospiraceae bacterium]|nr:hypothetical protein [Oscillospiraceae bacterium]
MNKKSVRLIVLICVILAVALFSLLRGNGNAPAAPSPAQQNNQELIILSPTPAPNQTTPDPEPSGSAPPTEMPEDQPAQLDENGSYNSKEDVALYIHTYGHLPDNYVTKEQARAHGWTGGSVEPYMAGCSIGGDVFGNREGLLPKAAGRTYYECDIDTAGKASRGAKRIVFSNDGLIYYTDYHYESFTLLYGEE